MLQVTSLMGTSKKGTVTSLPREAVGNGDGQVLQERDAEEDEEALPAPAMTPEGICAETSPPDLSATPAVEVDEDEPDVVLVPEAKVERV